MVTLVDMTPGEFRGFLERSIPDYAQALARSGRWAAANALERARAEYAQLLPNGVETPNHYLRTVHDAGVDGRVGEVWYAFQQQESWPQLFLHWIGIDEPYRRRGYASEVLRQLELEAGRRGAVRIALHVFGDNATARTFYERMGYQATNILMAKRLSR